VAVFYMLAVMSAEVFGVILAGYGSGSKWSLFGGMREAAQVVSYEVPMAICVLVPVIVAGSMSLTQISIAQEGFFWQWYVFRDPFTFCAFWTYFTCATASCKRAPFDLAEAESELVAGFHTEYSGLRWSFFFMAEYASMFAVSGIATHLFLGGWHLGLPIQTLFGKPADASNWLAQVVGSADSPSTLGFALGNVSNVVFFLIKAFTLVFVMMWVRWTLPRLRIDQVMMTCLKYLLPISCALLLGVSLWYRAMPPEVLGYLRFGLGPACVLFAVVMVYKAWSLRGTPLSGSMPQLYREAQWPEFGAIKGRNV
jgi:NADH-quinone oxidoreductase subunit H